MMRWSMALTAMALLLAGSALAADPPPATAAPNPLPIGGLEDYVTQGMKAFDVPGAAIGIVVQDEVLYTRAFGIKSKSGRQPVDTGTVFQIASTSKAFLATMLALAVDRGKLKWDDRIVDLMPDFQLWDAWVTRELRLYDIIAQRSGLTPNANDVLAFLGFDADTQVRSLRYTEPVASFRSTFSYLNIPHIVAGRLAAGALGAPDWGTALQRELFDPLGMKNSSYTRAAIEAHPNHASGHRYDFQGSIEIPFTDSIPYVWGGGGGINSSVDDLTHWLRFQLANGTFNGKSVVSPANLSVTRTPRVARNERQSYAMGWMIERYPNGTVVWHNGSSHGFGAYVGLDLDRKLGVVVLTNEYNVGFPDALGAWIMDRLSGRPQADYGARKLEAARQNLVEDAKTWTRPANPRPFASLASLAGSFAGPLLGKVKAAAVDDAVLLTLQTSGAQLRLEPWDGDVFLAKLVPVGAFAAMEASLGRPIGFVQLQMGNNGQLDTLRLTVTETKQTYEVRREP